MKKYLISLFIAIFVLEIGINVSAKNFDISTKKDSFDVVVNSKSGPWNPTINMSRNYIHKLRVKRNGLASPTIIRVKPGDNLTIEYVFGDVYADFQGHPERKTDADGYPKTMNTCAGRLPSFYINDQINHMALIGTFADSKGVMVGSPFFVGNGSVNLTVPEGAKQLQLGINDNLFRDNSGLFIVKVNINN
ncbi:MAG: hypothetical protein UR30_C0005G0118 [Candidatus Peregrinibacteria bacterium GW2011_GWC2_33_13]|nr:MAG: hypothetical protein UR30_C0005G0118 [Candidatus Peregrinibacteria bacterium GW2011_GWC2_33_13]